MNARDCLSTRTERCCPQCGSEFVSAEPTDLVTHPTEVNLMCPECHFPGRATLTEINRCRTVFPSPDALRSMKNVKESVGRPVTAPVGYSLRFDHLLTGATRPGQTPLHLLN